MKRPLAYITAAWSGDPCEATEQAAKYAGIGKGADGNSVPKQLRIAN